MLNQALYPGRESNPHAREGVLLFGGMRLPSPVKKKKA